MKAQFAQNWKDKIYKSLMDNVHKILKEKMHTNLWRANATKTVMWQSTLYPEVTIHIKSWYDNIHKMVYKQSANIVNEQFT